MDHQWDFCVWNRDYIFCFSTDQEPWTGIYNCKGEGHQDKVYCGQGNCAFDRKRKIINCKDEDWTNWNRSLTLGKQNFDFRKFKHYIMFLKISNN